MTNTIEMTNEKIYSLASSLISCFEDNFTLPVKINFYLQKNINKIIELGREIETARMDILNKYGTLNDETGQYNFDEASAKIATEELKELMALTQEIDIHIVKLDDFGESVLTGKQMSSIEFMIEE